MKRFLPVLAVLLLTVACSREELSSLTHVVSFTAEESDTRTSMTDKGDYYSFSWDGSDLRRLHVTENGVEAVALNAWLDSGKLKVKATFTGAVPADPVYSCFMAAHVSESGNPTLNSGSAQWSSGSYDSEYDILAATDTKADSRQGELPFRFERPVVINKMSLKGIAEGECISHISISADKSLTGEYDIYSRKWSSGTSTINVESDAVVKDGRTDIYFISIPAYGAKLSLNVETASGKIYSKSLSSLISLKKNTVTCFTVDMTGCESSEGPFSFATGTVTYDDGTAAEGVVVTDGFHCTATDAAGNYKLRTCSDSWFISLSMPSDAVIDNGDGAPGEFLRYDNMVKEYDFTLVRQSPESEFMLFALGDPQAHHSPRSPQKEADTDRFAAEAVPGLNKHIAAAGIPCYGVTLGDIVYSEGSRNSNAGFPIMKSHMSKVNMPIFETMGNHDYSYFYYTSPIKADGTSSSTNLKAQRKFEETFGPVDHSFNRGNTHVVCMKDIIFKSTTDASSYKCGFSDEQWTWLQEDLSYVSKDKQVILCVHIPLASVSDKSADHIQEVLNLISQYRNATVFSGHTHYHRGYSNAGGIQGLFEHIHAAVCGQWWWSRIEGDGAPAGFTVYKIENGTITDEYFTGFNEGMDERSYQMRMYRGNLLYGGSRAYFQTSHSSNTLLINVFNGDSRWKVQVYEDGVFSGNATRMAWNRYTLSSVKSGQTYNIPVESSQDWWAIGLHIGVIGRGTSSESYYTSNFHMWKYELGSTTAKVKVVATDPYGNSYECEDIIEDGLDYPAMYRASL